MQKQINALVREGVVPEATTPQMLRAHLVLIQRRLEAGEIKRFGKPVDTGRMEQALRVLEAHVGLTTGGIPSQKSAIAQRLGISELIVGRRLANAKWLLHMTFGITMNA